MSNVIIDLIVTEQNKLSRRRNAVKATETEIEVFGEDPKLSNKLVRQQLAVQESVERLEKLNKAAGSKK